MKKVAIVGPESSGKSTLAQDLMVHVGAWMVAEVAREYIDELERPYEEADLLEIAKTQVENEDMVGGEPMGKGLVVCDTDLITIRIWSEEKFGRCHPWIAEQTEQRHYDLWLLCAPDMPWEPDPLRENPHDRDRLFGLYVRMLDRWKKPYVILTGERDQRLKAAMKAILGQGE